MKGVGKVGAFQHTVSTTTLGFSEEISGISCASDHICELLGELKECLGLCFPGQLYVAKVERCRSIKGLKPRLSKYLADLSLRAFPEYEDEESRITSSLPLRQHCVSTVSIITVRCA